ncbi:MAG: Na+/H+ antiporter NhaA [Anaerolineae bacterium]
MKREPPAERRLSAILRAPLALTETFREFAHSEATGAVILLVAAIVALVWANSPWAYVYVAILHTDISVSVGQHVFSLSLHHFINDGLMTLFFLVVGLEIKREMLVGELASPRKAILPVTAALGGMLIPALIFTAFNLGGVGQAGWGIPMATDIAFALGILALLGARVVPGLKVYLTALAIADDLGAVLVIAVFYTASVSFAALAVAALLLVVMFGANHRGVRSTPLYIVLGVGVWLAMYLSGVHATVAGVLIALTIPVRAQMDPEEFLVRGYTWLGALEGVKLTTDSMIHDRRQLELIMELHDAAREMRPPGLVIEHGLHPFIAYFVIPLFALFNAGVPLEGGGLSSVLNPVGLGVLLGLVLGKQIGVTFFSWLAVRFGWASLPEGVSWRMLYGVSWLAGVGFTMSLFVTELAFTDEYLINEAKLGILLASLVAGVVGLILLRLWLPTLARIDAPAPRSAQEVLQ